MGDEAPSPCPITQRPIANIDTVRVLDTTTGVVWRWVQDRGGWTRVGKYYEIDADMDDAIIQYKRKGRQPQP